MFVKSILNIVALIVTCSLLIGPTSAFADTESAKHKIVFHMAENDPAKWKGSMGAVRNVINALGKDNVQIEIVAGGPGVNMVKQGSEVTDPMSELGKQNVSFTVCRASMKANKMAEEEVTPGVTIVPLGYVELMQKQEEGWAYIKL